jgi:xanthosine utilization system XapX-like protein
MSKYAGTAGAGASLAENAYLFGGKLTPEADRLNVALGAIAGGGLLALRKPAPMALAAFGLIPKHIGVGLYSEVSKMSPIVRQATTDFASWLAANKEIESLKRDTARTQFATAQEDAARARSITPAQALAQRGVSAVDAAAKAAPWLGGAALLGGLGYAGHRVYKHLMTPEKPVRTRRASPPRVVLRQPGQYTLQFDDHDNDPTTPPRFGATAT